jgi:SAM-dependent methyltransferase
MADGVMMAETVVNVTQRVGRLTGHERILLLTPGPHGATSLSLLLPALAGHPCTVLDSSAQRLSSASQRAVANSAQIVGGRATRLPFIRHSFDAVISVESLYSIRPPWTVLAEIHRVLVPDGKLVLFEPACYGLFSSLRDKLTGPGKRIFEIDEVKARLARGDYAIDHIEENLRVDGFQWPAYCLRVIKKENPAEPVPQYRTAREMIAARKKAPAGEELP